MPEDPRPIEPDEIVFRRIPQCEYQADLPIPIQSGAFKPSKSDTDGLSVFRERVISPEAILRSSRKAAENYIVARFRVHDLLQMGLTLTPTNQPNEPPGHALIVELRTSAYQADKAKHREIHYELAKLGSRDMIVDIISES